MVTIFENIHKTDSPHYITVESAIDRVRSGRSKDLITQIRSIGSKSERNELKKKLPCLCLSGKFSERSISGLIEHSGFISIDFDGYESELELSTERFSLEMDQYTYACFLSPSGDGLKVLVKIPKTDASGHKRYFDALCKHYGSDKFDKKCSDISRVTYESYDPDVYVNENSEVWNEMAPIQVIESRVVDIPIEDDNKVIENLLRWWNKNHGMSSGSRNNNIYVLARSLNQYGIDKHKAEEVCLRYVQPDFSERELLTCVWSAYKNTDEFNTKKFEDNEKVDAVVKMVAQGVPVNKIVEHVDDIPIEKVEEIQSRIVDNVQFWNIDRKGKVEFINHRYRDFLDENGFCKYYPSGSQNFVFVRILDNVMSDTSDNEIKDFVYEYLDGMDDMRVYDAYAEKTKMGREDFLSMLYTIKPKVLRDTKDTCYLYYNNYALKITKDNIDTIPYPDLDQFIWARQKVDRDFSIVNHDDCEYKRFIHNIAGNDKRRIESMESTIGFLLHSYKPANECPAVILNDETISDNPEGGTGKGIFVHAISMIKKNVMIDGKGFSFVKSFTYQRVSADTQIITFQDIEKSFNFEKLFSVVTDGITVEKKNKQEIFIPFEESPKVVITTNYAVKGAGNSHERRKWELELAQHYSKKYTPADEFGHQLFYDWTTEEWLKFDNYMIHCLQLYLKKGLVESPFKNLEIRKLEASTSPEFREWVLDPRRKYIMAANMEYVGQDLLNDFCENYPDFGLSGKIKLSHKTFYRWMHEYAKYRFGMPFKEGRNQFGRTITFVEQKKQLELDVP